MSDVLHLLRYSRSLYETRGALMKLCYSRPLLLFLVPNILIAYGFVFPHNKLCSFNDLTIGFAMTLFFAGLTYVIGVRKALHDAARH